MEKKNVSYLQNPGVFWYSLQTWVRVLIILSGLVIGVVSWLIVVAPFVPYLLFVLLGTTQAAGVLKIVFGMILIISILIALIFIPWLWYRILFRIFKSNSIVNGGGGLAEQVFRKEE